MRKQVLPTISQANVLYLILVIVITVGSAILQPILGLGGNLWVNEFVYLLFPAVLLAKIHGWSWREVYRFRKTSGSNVLLGILSGVSIWFFAAYISIIVTTILDKSIGKITVDLSKISNTPLQGILMLIGMVILAPLCEEMFFRGFVQRAYEHYSKKYSFIIAGVLFGIFHVLNGVNSVFSATIMGLVLGYLVFSTNSIFTSMSAHAAMNFSALVFSSALMTMDISKIPLWFHAAAFLGLGLCLLLLRTIKRKNIGEPHINFAEGAAIHKQKGNAYVALAISILILFAIGSLEVVQRLGFLAVPTSTESKTVVDGKSNITCGSSSTNSLVVGDFSIDENAINSSLNLWFSYECSTAGFKLELIDVDGEVIWDKQFNELKVKNNEPDKISLKKSGKYTIRIHGKIDNLKLSSSWKVLK